MKSEKILANILLSSHKVKEFCGSDILKRLASGLKCCGQASDQI